MTGIVKRNWLPLICIVSGLIVLCGLGSWQVKRLYWKEGLLERIEMRIQQQPVSLLEVAGFGFNKLQQDYLPVELTGEYDHNTEAYFFTTGPHGEPGWNVHTAVRLPDGRSVIVNRGFVPFDFKSPASRSKGQVSGSQELRGLLRFPLKEKPLGSLDNNLSTREFYWRNIKDFAQVMGLDEKKVLPIIVDLAEYEIPGGMPKGGATILSFPNNHLQYAITWFGLALTLLGVGGVLRLFAGTITK